MACRTCGPTSSVSTPRTNTRRSVPKGQKQSWVVVYRSGGQDVEKEFTGGNSDYLAACREAAKYQGRVWPKSLRDQHKKEAGQ